MRPPILITGAPRSGVSLTAALLELSGAFCGRVGRENHYTQRYRGENLAIRHSIVRPFLSGMLRDMETHRGGKGPGGEAFPSTARCQEVVEEVAPSWRRRVLETITEEGYQGGPWFYKSSSSALIWPIWQAAFPGAQWLIVRRADAEIVRSCLETGYMRAHTTAEGWQGWLEVYKERFREMIRGGANLWQFWPERIMAGELGELRDMTAALGLIWCPERIADHLAPALWQSGIYSLRG